MHCEQWVNTKIYFLLEYLEDIIGTTRYDVTIDKAYEKIEEVNEERLEKLNRTKILEREKQGLKVKY